MDLFLAAAADLPRAYLLTAVALIASLAVAARAGTKGKSIGGSDAARRLRWHWPAYVAAYEAIVNLNASLACSMLPSQSAIIDNFLVTAAAAGLALPLAAMATAAIERLATRGAGSTMPPLPVAAAFCAVALNWSLILYLVSALGKPLRYAGS